MQELKLIVDTISKVSGDAQTILIVYFVKDFLISVLNLASIVGCIIFGLKYLFRALGWFSFTVELMRLMDIGPYPDPFCEKHRAKLIQKIIKLKQGETNGRKENC